MTAVHPDTPARTSRGVAVTADEKAEHLRAWLREAGSVLVGFSGGVDSAYLAAAAVEALGADRVLCVVGRSASYPEAQWETARRVAREFVLPLLEVDTHEIDDVRYAANPTNRCYFCKNELWQVLTPIARERGIAVVVDGTNADDLGDYRPGAVAAKEQGVRSPLAEVGLTKAEIRELSRARGLPTWSQPSSPCLSSRIPYHTPVTSERLRQVERAEQALRDLGVQGDFRVRHHDELARVELSRGDLDRFMEPGNSELLRAALVASGYLRVAIDVRGFRSGSLNVLEGVVAAGA